MCQSNKHCSYVFVDSNQITGGRKTHGDNPQAPAAATPQKDPFGKPKVSSPKCIYARSNFSWCNSGSLFTMTGLERISSISCK